MKQYEGALRLLGCILAETPEDFYRCYPGKKKRKKEGKYDYYYRMLRADPEKFKELKRRKADYMLEYRRKKNDRAGLSLHQGRDSGKEKL